MTAARRLLALALGLWLSGAGCLACCEGTARAATHHAGAGQAPHELLAAIREAERAAPAAMSADHSCCEARVGSRARAKTKETRVTEAAATKAGDAETVGPSTGPGARRETVPGVACCRRVLQTAEQARKARVQPVAAQAPSTPAPPAHASALRQHSFVRARPRPPDRGSTYLLCRTLLI